MAVEIVESTVAEMRERAGPLLAAHWEEATPRKMALRFAPNWLVYEACEQSGWLIVLLAQRNGLTIGYSVARVFGHPHAIDTMVCQSCALFVDPEHRGSGAGLRLIEATERIAKGRGANVMLWHAKEDGPARRLFERRGYPIEDVVFSKELT